MTQEQKQIIIKALQSGILAIANEHIAALEEVARIAEVPQEELNGLENFEQLNQERYNITVKVIQASLPFMAREYIDAYNMAIGICYTKFEENKKEKSKEDKTPVPQKKQVKKG